MGGATRKPLLPLWKADRYDGEMNEDDKINVVETEKYMRIAANEARRNTIINLTLIVAGFCIYPFTFPIVTPHGPGPHASFWLWLTFGPLVGAGLGRFAGRPLLGIVLGFVGQFLLLPLAYAMFAPPIG